MTHVRIHPVWISTFNTVSKASGVLDGDQINPTTTFNVYFNKSDRLVNFSVTLWEVYAKTKNFEVFSIRHTCAEGASYSTFEVRTSAEGRAV